MVRATWVQSQFVSYQRLLKWHLIPPCLSLSNIRYISRVKWNNPGKGVVPSPIPQCSSYWKGSLRVALDYGRQLDLLSQLTRIITSTATKNIRSNNLKPLPLLPEGKLVLWIQILLSYEGKMNPKCAVHTHKHKKFIDSSFLLLLVVVTYLPSRKLFKLDEPDMQDTAVDRDELISDVLLWTTTYGRAKAGRPARTYPHSSSVRIRDVAQKTCQRRWTIGRSGERVRDICAVGTTWWWWW